MKKLVISGCSFSSGAGFENTKNSEHLWVNLCHKNIDILSNLNLDNRSQDGFSNAEIFREAINAIAIDNENIDYLFCAWTFFPRLNFQIGFELYETNASLSGVNGDINLTNINYTKSYINEVTNRFRVLLHSQKEIIDLIKYVNIVKNLSKKFNIKIVNINSMCPWDTNFFNFIDYSFPEELTNITKTEILNFKNRDDKEIKQLYNKQHIQYQNEGGIQESSWLNLYNSFKDQQIDVNLDNQHPGIKSNFLYYTQIKNYLETMQLS